MTDPPPRPYVVRRVQDALAGDARVGELGLRVDDDGAGGYVVRGAVSTVDRKAAVRAVVAEILAALGVSAAVHDETYVPSATPPLGDEEVT